MSGKYNSAHYTRPAPLKAKRSRKLNPATMKIMERAVESVAHSKQPRWTEDSIASSVLRMVRRVDMEEPPYRNDSRVRDKWLFEFAQLEPHLIGVINTVVSLDSNRRWTMLGAEDQVEYFSRVLRDADGGQGWRAFMSRQARQYYCCDIGSVTEVGRDVPEGVMAGLFHLDSTRCKFSGNYESPFIYYPRNGKPVDLDFDDVYQCVSLPSGLDEFAGIGYSAVSRVLQLTKLMLGVYLHDQESLIARPPRGFLVIQGISQAEWQRILDKRRQDRENMGLDVYQDIIELVSPSRPIKVDVEGLSKLPSNFDIRSFTYMLMYAYSLIFGYDVSEFYPMESSAFGRGRESWVQARKASTKGELSYVLLQQEGIQRYLPESIIFEFDRRDEEGERMSIELQREQAKAITDLYVAGLQYGRPIINENEARALLREAGILPESWGDLADIMTDNDSQKSQMWEKYRSHPELRSAARLRPSQPIVRYNWPSNRVDLIADNGHEFLKPRFR